MSDIMSHPPTFAQAIDVVEELSLDDQEALVDVIRNRIREQRRQQLMDEVRQAEQEIADGKAKAVAVDELMAEIDR